MLCCISIKVCKGIFILNNLISSKEVVSIFQFCVYLLDNTESSSSGILEISSVLQELIGLLVLILLTLTTIFEKLVHFCKYCWHVSVNNLINRLVASDHNNVLQKSHALLRYKGYCKWLPYPSVTAFLSLHFDKLLFSIIW